MVKIFKIYLVSYKDCVRLIHFILLVLTKEIEDNLVENERNLLKLETEHTVIKERIIINIKNLVKRITQRIF